MAREVSLADDDQIDFTVLCPVIEFPYIDSSDLVHALLLVSLQPLLRHIHSRRSYDIGTQNAQGPGRLSRRDLAGHIFAFRY